MEAKYTIGIGLNLFDARAVLMRGDGKVVACIEKPRVEVNANETIEVLLKLFEEIIEASSKFKNSIESVGVALGGIISNKGVAYWPQRQDATYTYMALPLKDYLEKKFGFSVVLENDANACVAAECSVNFPKQKNVVYMFSGVGLGMVIDGKVYRGKDGGAGELFLNSKGSTSSWLGDFSFLKQWPVDLGMVKRAKELITAGQYTSLIKKITPTGELKLSDIFTESKKDKVARDILKEAAFSLGAKTAFLVNLLNPEVVIVGGGLEEAPDFFLDECVSAVKNFSFSEMRKNLKISYSALGRSATSLGAALLAFKKEAN